MTVKEKRKTQRGKSSSRYLTLEAFQKKYLEKENYKYEWKSGRLEKNEYMKREERYLIDNIIRKFAKTEGYQKGNSIMAEVDCYFSQVDAYRRPDAAYLTEEQIKHPEESPEAPALVIEVVSPSNTDLKNKQKILEYFEAGVQMAWYIYPELQQIWRYTLPFNVTVCRENDVCMCIADPVVPDFSIAVKEIFEK